MKISQIQEFEHVLFIFSNADMTFFRHRIYEAARMSFETTVFYTTKIIE